MSNGWKAILLLVFTVLLIYAAVTVDIPGESTAIILVMICTLGAAIYYSILWFREWSDNIIEYNDM